MLIALIALLISVSTALYGLLLAVQSAERVSAKDMLGALFCGFALAFVVTLIGGFAGLFDSI